jgi:glucose-1-phosphatase
MSGGPFSCLLLDIGNVLVDLNYHHLSNRMQAITGLGPLDLQARLAADGLVRQFETGKLNASQFHAEVCRRTGIEIPWPDFLAAWNCILGPPLVSEDVVASIARKVRLWLVSNTNELHFDFMIRHFAFPRYCEGFVLSHEVGALKPDVRIFAHALQRLGSDPSEVLYADDQEVNVKAARCLGIRSFQVHGPGHLEAELGLHRIL